MEFWLDNSVIAFTTKESPTASSDVWEENAAGLAFNHSASFRFETDARLFLVAKYPSAIETTIVGNRRNGIKETARLTVPRPKSAHALLDDDPWRKQDHRRFRATISRCLIPKRQKQGKPSLFFNGLGGDDAA